MSEIVLARGEGSHVFDVEGNRYVDLAAGFGAALLGHGHRAIVKAIRTQSERLIQGLGDVYDNDIKLKLIGALRGLHHCPDADVRLCTSGGDAVTAAMKTATVVTGKHAFIAFDGAYHGLGYAPLPACGYNASFRKPYAPQLSHEVKFAPYPGVRGASMDAALSMVKSSLDDVAAIMVEPVMGRGGCHVPPDGFMKELVALAHERDALLIADEIWTGLGRAGSLVRSRAVGAQPDILCFGKGLGGGLPISACVAMRSMMDGVMHTSTHAGAPLACAAALATMATLERERLVARASELGARALTVLRDRLDQPVRGAGLMIGIEFASAVLAEEAMRHALGRGYLLIGGGVDHATLTITPALTIDEEALLGVAEALS